jgi:hypothetical protein
MDSKYVESESIETESVETESIESKTITHDLKEIDKIDEDLKKTEPDKSITEFLNKWDIRSLPLGIKKSHSDVLDQFVKGYKMDHSNGIMFFGTLIIIRSIHCDVIESFFKKLKTKNETPIHYLKKFMLELCDFAKLVDDFPDETSEDSDDENGDNVDNGNNDDDEISIRKKDTLKLETSNPDIKKKEKPKSIKELRDELLKSINYVKLLEHADTKYATQTIMQHLSITLKMPLDLSDLIDAINDNFSRAYTLVGIYYFFIQPDFEKSLRWLKRAMYENDYLAYITLSDLLIEDLNKKYLCFNKFSLSLTDEFDYLFDCLPILVDTHIALLPKKTILKPLAVFFDELYVISSKIRERCVRLATKIIMCPDAGKDIIEVSYDFLRKIVGLIYDENAFLIFLEEAKHDFEKFVASCEELYVANTLGPFREKHPGIKIGVTNTIKKDKMSE